MSDERLARWVALGILIVFGAFAVIALLDSKRPIPDPLYPLAIAGAGYIFGWRLLRKGDE